MGIVHAIVQAILFQPPKATYDDHSNLMWLQNSLGEQFPVSYDMHTTSRVMLRFLRHVLHRSSCIILSCQAIFIPHPHAEWTIIFSHANSEDLGFVHEWANELCYHVGVNVCIYDYTGYGLSSGSPSEEACYADVEAVWDFLTIRLRIPENRIVAYGRSLGSGPSVEIAIRKPIRAVILQSAFVSIYRVALGTESRSLSGDMFRNIEKVSQLTCPVLVIHGTKDQLVPFSHGEALYNAARERAEPLWIQEGAHNNLEIYWKTTLTRRLCTFLHSLEINDGVHDPMLGQCDIHDPLDPLHVISNQCEIDNMRTNQQGQVMMKDEIAAARKLGRQRLPEIDNTTNQQITIEPASEQARVNEPIPCDANGTGSPEKQYDPDNKQDSPSMLHLKQPHPQQHQTFTQEHGPSTHENNLNPMIIQQDANDHDALYK